jgi:hypothetical protein
MPVRPLLALGASLWLAACARAVDTPANAKDGGEAPPKHVRVVDAGSPPDANTTCGETLCAEPVTGSPLHEIACCLPSLACGVRSPLFGDRCLEPGQPGGVDPGCPSVTAANGAVVAGCCTPSGRCGRYDGYGALGCVLVDSSDAGLRCRYDPENTCRMLLTIPCDGPEDCPGAEACCGRASFGVYDAFGCFPTCAVATNADRGLWRELCHSPADCREPGSACVGEPNLPASVGRCAPASPPDSGPSATDASEAGPRPVLREAGTDAPDGSGAGVDNGVGCGDERCEPGLSCCRREPAAPYCVPRGGACTCEGPRPNDD